MNGVAIYDNICVHFGRHLTESLNQDKHCWGLLILDARFEADDDKVEEDGDVGDFVRVEWSDDSITVWHLISCFCDQHQHFANLEEFGTSLLKNS